MSKDSFESICIPQISPRIALTKMLLKNTLERIVFVVVLLKMTS